MGELDATMPAAEEEFSRRYDAAADDKKLRKALNQTAILSFMAIIAILFIASLFVDWKFGVYPYDEDSPLQIRHDRIMGFTILSVFLILLLVFVMIGDLKGYIKLRRKFKKFTLLEEKASEEEEELRDEYRRVRRRIKILFYAGVAFSSAYILWFIYYIILAILASTFLTPKPYPETYHQLLALNPVAVVCVVVDFVISYGIYVAAKSLKTYYYLWRKNHRGGKEEEEEEPLLIKGPDDLC